MNTFFLYEQKDRFELSAQAIIVGNDILIILCGGKAHIGAVAMAQPSPSIANPQKTGATSSVYTYIGHKDDVIAKAMSEKLAKNLNRKVVVVVGVHWENLKTDEIGIINNMSEELTKKVATELQHGGHLTR